MKKIYLSSIFSDVPKDKLYVFNGRPTKRKIPAQITLPMQPVEGNKMLYTERERRNEALARQSQMRLSYPSSADILEGINKRRIINLPITRADMETATKIWDRDLRSVVWKSTRKTPEAVIIERYEEAEADKRIVLCVDIFYIGGLTFLLSVSRRLNMFMVSYLNWRTVTNLKSAISSQVSTYKSRNYIISYILVDNASGINVAIPYSNNLGIVMPRRMNTFQKLREQVAPSRNVCVLCGTLCPTNLQTI